MGPALLGVRVDVDTHDGMRDGVPGLLRCFEGAGARGTFYLTMGPDRAGRAVFNLLRPGFLGKMRRTRAARVYGVRTVLSGTLLPARPVATAFPEIAREVERRGHESGVHAWDHRAWQDRLDRFPPDRVRRDLDRGFEAYRGLYGRPPGTYAAPAWFVNDEALLHEESYGLAYASDCRGREPFLPIVRGTTLATPQVPSTLPTLDEALGDTVVSAADYFERVLEQARGQAWPVLTVHAELEGGPYAAEFAAFLERAAAAGLAPVPLGDLLRGRLAAGPLAACTLTRAPVPGRHGELSTQT